MFFVWLDIALMLFFVAAFVFRANKENEGFFGILIPYAFIGVMVYVVPIAIASVNLIGALLTDRNPWWPISPLIVPLLAFATTKTHEMVNVRFYHKTIKPMKETITSFLEENHLHVSSVQVRSRKKKGEIIVEIDSKDSETLRFSKERMTEKIKERYPGFSVILYTKKQRN